MKTPKIKRYRLGVSRNFPATHPRKGEKTQFVDSIYFGNKRHTIRSNYELWSKRIAEVQAGYAVIELFYWSGKPYHKDENGIGQVVFATLDKGSGCGVQKIYFKTELKNTIMFPFIPNDVFGEVLLNVFDVSDNDGLSFKDFEAWFKGYDLSEPMAIIHFTPFRY
jgi:hypothetical protein